MEKSKGSKGNQYTEKLDRFHDGTSPTLRDLGIHKKQSQRWQQIAAELGVSQKTVSNDLVINSVRTEKTTKQPLTRFKRQSPPGCLNLPTNNPRLP